MFFQLKKKKKWTFGSLITSAYHHGFHPNLIRVTPTMCTFSPVKMVKIWENKKYHLLWCFHWKVTQKCNFGVTYNYYECPWIPSKFGMMHSHCTLIHPCEYELNLRNQKISSTLVFSQTVTQKCNFGVTYNYYECPWIPSKFEVKHSHCTFIYPCEYEQNLRIQKFHLCT